MNVTSLARRADTTADTVRHYTDLGLLRPRRNPHNGYREYGHEELRRLQFALQARELGFTLADVRQIVAESDSGHSPCGDVRRLIEERLEEVESEIRRLRKLSGRMKKAMTLWQQQPDTRPGEGRICGLIESMTGETGEAGA